MSKEAEYREYLLKSGMFDITLKLLVALAEKPDISDAEALFQDYYGCVRDPVWDEITRLTDSSNILRDSNLSLEAKLTELSSEVAMLQGADICSRIWNSIRVGTNPLQATKKQILDTLNGTEATTVNPDIQALIPDNLGRQELLDYLQRSDDARKIASKWLGTDGIIPWGNQLTDDLTTFWTNLHVTPSP